MDNPIIFCRFITILYVCLNFIKQKDKSRMYVYSFVIVLLIYAAFIILEQLIYKNKEKLKLVLILEGIFIFIAVEYIDVKFCFFLPSYVYSIFEEGIKPVYNIIIVAVSWFFIPPDLRNEFVVVAFLTYICFRDARISNARVNDLNERCDRLSALNSRMQSYVDENKVYKKQIMYTLQLEERNKLSQKMHDKIGHTISGSLMMLESAIIVMDKDKEKGTEIIKSVISVLRNGMEDIRKTLRSIKPVKEELGINRIKLLANEFENNKNIKVNLFYYGDLEYISYDEWNVIYDNITEALTNSVKYSDARNIKITIDILEKLVKVEIKDDGKGNENFAKGMGITGMEERTSKANGKLIIDGSNGFSVIMLLPLSKKK